MGEFKPGYVVRCSCGESHVYEGIVSLNQVERYNLLKRFDREHGRQCGGSIDSHSFIGDPEEAKRISDENLKHGKVKVNATGEYRDNEVKSRPVRELADAIDKGTPFDAAKHAAELQAEIDRRLKGEDA